LHNPQARDRKERQQDQAKEPDASTSSPIGSEHNSGAGGNENGPSAAVKIKGNGAKEANEPHKEGYIHETSARPIHNYFVLTSDSSDFVFL
jgi:hypothetical protein